MVLPPLARDATPTSDCPPAADRPRWAEAPRVGPTARGPPNRLLLRRRARRPPERRCARPEHRRGRFRTVHDPPLWPRDPELARCLRRRPPDPKARRPSALAPSAPRRTSPTGRRTVRVGVGREHPPGAAREHHEAKAPRRPTLDLRELVAGQPTRDPHDSVLRCPTAIEPSGARPHDLGSTVSPPPPAAGFGEPEGCSPCRHGGRRPRHSIAHRACPHRQPRCGHDRSRARSAKHCASVREPDRMRPPVLLGTSSRQAHSSAPPNRIWPTSPPARPGPRIHASSPSPNHVAVRFRSHRVGASSHPGWPTRAEARAHRRNRATREALVQCPDTLATVSPP